MRPTGVGARMPMPCPWICLGCGWLDDGPRAGDPMRTEGTRTPTYPCRHCGSPAWLDLGDAAAAANLRELELADLGARRRRLTDGARTLALAVGGLTPALLGAPLGVAIVGGAIGCAMASRRLIALLRDSERMRSPWRWRLPELASPRVGEVTRTGVVTADSRTRAPFSGRPCVAWRVDVRHARAQRGAVALAEQGSVPLAIDGTWLPAAPLLALPLEPCPGSEAASTFLASRGLDPNDALTLHEAVLDADTVVALHHVHHRGAGILCAHRG
ncbi:MAG: hypothetical protein IPK74_30905 [Deltaproteobacteria bacterium]|nr:hypothetical protein [Deltaproteobacteria bacterium]